MYFATIARIFGFLLVAALGVETGLSLVGVLALRVCRVFGDTVAGFSVGFIGDLGANRWTRDYCKFLVAGIFIGDRPILGLTGAFTALVGCEV